VEGCCEERRRWIYKEEEGVGEGSVGTTSCSCCASWCCFCNYQLRPHHCSVFFEDSLGFAVMPRVSCSMWHAKAAAWVGPTIWVGSVMNYEPVCCGSAAADRHRK